MKILYYDSLFPNGHKSVNNCYIHILQNMGEKIILCADRGWFDTNDDIEIIDKNWMGSIRNCKTNFSYRIKLLWNTIRFCTIIKKENPDVICFASYDIIATGLALPCLIKYRKRIVIQEHNNVDQLGNKVKFFFYSLYKNLFHHIVFEDYIGKHLIKLGVNNNMIHKVPLPIPPSSAGNIKGSDAGNLVIGLGNDNDDRIINKIVLMQKEKFSFDNIGYRFVVKSKKYLYEDRGLKVLNGWLTQDEYTKYSNNSKYYLLLYSAESYAYRVSAALMEAVSNGKYIITSRFPLVEFYNKAYPGLCYIFDTIDDIITCLDDVSKDGYNEARENFIKDHSDEMIAESLMDLIVKISNNKK